MNQQWKYFFIQFEDLLGGNGKRQHQFELDYFIIWSYWKVSLVRSKFHECFWRILKIAEDLRFWNIHNFDLLFLNTDEYLKNFPSTDNPSRSYDSSLPHKSWKHLRILLKSKIAGLSIKNGNSCGLMMLLKFVHIQFLVKNIDSWKGDLISHFFVLKGSKFSRIRLREKSYAPEYIPLASMTKERASIGWKKPNFLSKYFLSFI